MLEKIDRKKKNSKASKRKFGLVVEDQIEVWGTVHPTNVDNKAHSTSRKEREREREREKAVSCR